MSISTSATPVSMPANAVFPVPRLWTRDEYYRMGELGWFEGQRVELIGGEVVVMNPQGFPHYSALEEVFLFLRAAAGDQCWVRNQVALDLGELSQPEPDISVVPGKKADYHSHPSHAILVVEVSYSTLVFDRTRKASLYAAANIPEYWILDIENRTLEVRRSPTADPAQPYGFGYSARQILQADESISPPFNSAAIAKVSDFLP